MKKISKNTHLAVNIVLVLLGAYCLYFISNFWIGSEEQHKELINNSGVSFFFKKFAFNLVVIAFIIGFMAIVNKALKNEAMKKALLYSIILLIVISIITIYFSIK